MQGTLWCRHHDTFSVTNYYYHHRQQMESIGIAIAIGPLAGVETVQYVLLPIAGTGLCARWLGWVATVLFLVPPALGYLFALRVGRQSHEPAAAAETGAAGLPGRFRIAYWL